MDEAVGAKEYGNHNSHDDEYCYAAFHFLSFLSPGCGSTRMPRQKSSIELSMDLCKSLSSQIAHSALVPKISDCKPSASCSGETSRRISPNSWPRRMILAISPRPKISNSENRSTITSCIKAVHSKVRIISELPPGPAAMLCANCSITGLTLCAFFTVETACRITCSWR